MVKKEKRKPPCTHYWKIVDGVGTCQYCGEVKVFPRAHTNPKASLSKFFAEKGRRGGMKRHHREE